MTMSTITAQTEVDAPVRLAYDQWTRFEEFPSFMRAVKSVEQLDDEDLRWVVDVGGMTRQFDARIIDQVPDDHIEWQSLEEPLHHGRVDFESIDAGRTRVTLLMEWQPETFLERAGAALSVDDAAVRRDLERFKDIVEGGEVGPGWRGEIRDGESAPTGRTVEDGTAIDHPELGDPTDPDAPGYPRPY